MFRPRIPSHLRCVARATAVAAARLASSGSSGSASACSADADRYFRSAQEEEEEEDKLLEEEEFAAFDEKSGDEYLPLAHRLASKADALDKELARLRWVLFERRQLLMDTAPATFTGRPTRSDHVVETLKACREGRRRRQRHECCAGSHPNQQRDEQEAASTSHAQHHVDASSHAGGSGAMHASSSTAVSRYLTAVDYAPYTNWQGSSAVLPQLYSRLLHSKSQPRKNGAASSSLTAAVAGKELVTLTADLDYLRRVRDLHALNYYSRMYMTPKRHIGHALYQTIWNAWLAIPNACGALCFTILRGVRDRGLLTGVCVGTSSGIWKAMQFCFYGWIVSPLIHVPRGLCNSLYGPVNFLKGNYMFEPMSGRWMRCTVVDAKLLRHSLQWEKRLLRTIGRAEFRRKRMAAENKWTQRLASMGFSVENFQEKLKGGYNQKQKMNSNSNMSSISDPYQTLGVKRTASQQHIKQQYKKLAMVFHPDVVGSQGPQTDADRQKAHDKFESISSAYQVLSNPEKRKAYDLGGAEGLNLHEGKFGHFMTRTPEQMVQSIFGGEAFRRRLIGELLRSHWSLRFEGQVSVSLSEFEELQSIRTRQVAAELADILDVHAKRPTTGPYYKHAAAAVGGAGSGVRRVVHSSSLPDPFGGGNSKHASFAARQHPSSSSSSLHNHSGQRVSPIGKDLKNDIMAELGDKSATQHSRKTRGGGGVRNSVSSFTSSSPSSAFSSPSSAGNGEKDASSPFVLVPGSNEYNCFSKDFEERCEKFVSRMAEACFGPELLSEIGLVYTTSAMRFLHIKPFYAPKQLMTRKVFTGIDRISAAFLEKTKMEKEELAKRVVVEYFNMEYDNIVVDMHVVVRFATQLALQDCTESEEVRRKRCYAAWYLGERMMSKGTLWSAGKRDDADMMAYVQQAANSSATTSKPPAF